MDVGASTVAFVTIGLQSVKVLHDFISAIKDGPSKLRDLQGALGSLESLLEQMQNFPGLTTAPTTTSSPILPVVKRCIDDIQRFEAEIGRIYVSPKDKACGKVWKRVKLAFKDKDIPYMISVVAGHLNALSLHCNVRSMTALSSMGTQQQGIEEVMKEVGRYVAKISSSTVKEDIIARQTEIHQTCVTAISTLSTAQTEIVGSLNDLKLFCKQTAATPIHSSLYNPNMRCQGQPEKADAWSRGLSDQLKQLFESFGEERRIIPASVAEDTIELIETLLDSVRNDFLAALFKHPPISPNKCKTLARELKQLAARFTMASSIRVNLGGLTDSIPFTAQMKSQESTGTIVRSNNGILTISKNIWKRDQRDQARLEKSITASPDWKSLTAITLLIRDGHSSGMLLKAYVREAVLPETTGYFSLAPTISAYRIVPSNSEVFECTRKGLVDDLIQLLNSGRASLRDRDELGASLLHYACSAGQPEICAFLINHGADIDDMADDGHITNFSCEDDEEDLYTRTPLAIAYAESGYRDKDNMLQCFKLLLEMGADPMLGDTAWWAFQIYAPEFAAAFLSFAQPFVDINFKLDWGWSFLHSATQNTEFAKVKLLVDNGIEIDTVNDKGMTALQSLLMGLRNCRAWCEEFESIKYLIQHGANIHAIYRGRSCSVIAYENDLQGSYAGDVWDAALAHTGHSVQEFRESHVHRSHYTEYYTMMTFRLFWEGMEARCPYYDEAARDDADGEDREDLRITDGESIPAMTGLYKSDSDEWETESESENDR